MVTIRTDIPVLSVLENLGALSENFGLIKIKPFKDWVGSSWQDKIFTYRLCNAGEIFDISLYCSSIAENARIHAMRSEILIRAIWEIGGRSLITPEELDTYNKAHNSTLTTIEYLRYWIRNVEQVIVERLDAIYGELQLKQARMLRKAYLCGVCGEVYVELPENSHTTLYGVHECVCGNCIADKADTSLIDFEKPLIVESQVLEEANKANEEHEVLPLDEDYVCLCQAKFTNFDDYNSHIQQCPEYNKQ